VNRFDFSEFQRLSVCAREFDLILSVIQMVSQGRSPKKVKPISMPQSSICHAQEMDIAAA